MKNIYIILLLALITACTKSVDTRPVSSNKLSKKIYLVIDYVEYRDDIGKLLIYDKHQNFKRINSLKAQMENLLKAKGFNQYEVILASSGIDFNPVNSFELLSEVEKKNQTLINPPFQITLEPNNTKLNHQLIQGFKLAQEAVAINDIMNIKNFPLIDTDEEALILYARVISPKISMGKTFLMAGLTGALTLTATGGAAILVSTPGSTPLTTIVLVDNNNGEVLWKNRNGINVAITSKKKMLKFYKSFPSLKN